MRKFVGNYLSGRVKTTGPGDVTSDRYDYISLDQAEPNFGKPSNNITQLPGTQGTNSFLMTTGAGDRRIVAIGDDLELEQIGTSGDYKLGIAAGATTETISLAQAASNLQSTLQVGMVADRPIQLTNTQDVSDVEVESGSFVTGTVYRITQVGLEDWEALDDNPVLVTGITYTQGTLFKANGAGSGAGASGSSDRGKAVAVPSFSTDGAIELGETLQLQDTKSIIWYNNNGTHDAYTRDSKITSTYNDSMFVKSSIDFIVGNRDHTGQNNMPTDAQSIALAIKENFNTSSGQQSSEIILGKNENNESASTPSESYIKSNQILILAPATVGATVNTGTVRIAGNLEVLGTQTTVNSTTLEVSDLNIVAAKDATTPAATVTGGLILGSYPTTATASTWVDPNDLQGQTANPLPSILWSANNRFLINKPIEVDSGVTVTGATGGGSVGYLRSDGSIDTTTFVSTGSVVNSQYDLTVTASSANSGTFQLQETGTNNADTIEISGSGGVDVITTAGGAANATIVVDGSGVSGTTYSLQSATNTTDNDNVDLTIQGITGNQNSTDTVTFEPGNNISVSSTSVDQIIISDSNTPLYSAAGAKVTIENTSVSDQTLTPFDVADLALEVSSATSGSVARFARTTQGDHGNGGVLLLEIDDDTTAAANPWISFLNNGDAVADSTQPCQGEITTKQSNGTDKSGIRIWGQDNIDFDVSSNAKPGNTLNETRVSIVGTGLQLKNASTIVHKGANYDTTLQFTAPTAARTITFPNSTGTVALAEDIVAGGPISTVASTANADEFVVLAATAVNSAGTTQDPKTHSGIKYNPTYGKLTLGGTLGGELVVEKNTFGNGNITCEGTLTAVSKSFLIDHPTKDNMKLQYACIEGPENAVYVRGRLKDDNIINLPDYWVGLVDENTITVNLTPIGHSQNLYVQDIINNQIIINDNENINCFYTIFAERKDVDKLVVEYEVL